MALEKQCANGVIFCQIIEAARPGTITMAKVNMNADAVRPSASLKATDLSNAHC